MLDHHLFCSSIPHLSFCVCFFFIDLVVKVERKRRLNIQQVSLIVYLAVRLLRMKTTCLLVKEQRYMDGWMDGMDRWMDGWIVIGIMLMVN